MNALSALVLLAGYVGFWAALLLGQRAWLDARAASLDAAWNASLARWECALSDSLQRSGAVVLLELEPPACGAAAWRPEVVRAAS